MLEWVPRFESGQDNEDRSGLESGQMGMSLVY